MRARSCPNWPPWASPLFPYLGWIILGWIITWVAVQLNMLQQLLDTHSLTGGQWGAVLGLSLIAPAVVAVDKVLQLRRQRVPGAAGPGTTVQADGGRQTGATPAVS